MSKQEAFPPFPEESELDEANEPHENLKIVERDLQRISEWREKTKKILREKMLTAQTSVEEIKFIKELLGALK